MGSETPIRNQFGTIVGVRPKEEADPIQATLDASLKAVGATPQIEPSSTPTEKLQTLQRPSWRMIATGVAALSIGVLAIVLFSGQTHAPPQLSTLPPPTVTALPTPHPTALPSIVPQPSPREVTLSPITLYGDYDEGTRIGQAPEGIICTLSGQSPDALWAYLSCPAPTNAVWARVVDLTLTATQRDTLLDTRIISRMVPTAPAFSPPSAPQGAGPLLAFCADRQSIWGKTHQCAATQSAANALADGEMGRINATAEAIHNKP